MEALWISCVITMTAYTLPVAIMEVIRVMYYCGLWCMGRRKADPRYPSNERDANNQGRQAEKTDMDLVA